jgi:hypothetical protein
LGIPFVDQDLNTWTSARTLPIPHSNKAVKEMRVTFGECDPRVTFCTKAVSVETLVLNQQRVFPLFGPDPIDREYYPAEGKSAVD